MITSLSPASTLVPVTRAPGEPPDGCTLPNPPETDSPGLQDAWWQSRTFWKNAALITVGTAAFVGAFAVSSGAVTLAAGAGASLGAKFGLGATAIYGAQAAMAGALGAVGGVALGAVKNGIKAVSSAIREKRYGGTSVAHELAKADAHFTKQLKHDAKHSLMVGAGAGTVLALGAVALPSYVLKALVGAVIAGGAFELGKLGTNVWGLTAEHRRAAKADAAGNLAAQKMHVWERDEEIEEIVLNLVNLSVLGVLLHSLEEIDPHDLDGITTGVAQSADEVVALAETPVAAAQQLREIQQAPAWMQRTRRILPRNSADT